MYLRETRRFSWPEDRVEVTIGLVKMVLNDEVADRALLSVICYSLFDVVAGSLGA